MREYIIKLKNSFKSISFKVYENNKQIGSFEGTKFNFKGISFEIPTSSAQEIQILKLPKKKVVGKLIRPLDNAYLLSTLRPNKIIINNIEYDAKPSGKTRINISVTKKGSDEILVSYVQKGWFAKKDIVRFSDSVGERDHPIFMGLLVWTIITNGYDGLI